MSSQLLLEFIWVSIALVGLILTIWAFRHLRDTDGLTQVRAILPDWPFHPDLYDEFGGKLCRIGRALIVLTLGFALVYFIVY